jgi:hypothetical protein
MKSVEAVMNEKSYFKYENQRFSFEGWVHLEPHNGASIHNDVQTVFTNVYIWDAQEMESMYLREFDWLGFSDAFNSWKSEAILSKTNEWADAVRAERKYDLFAGYQNAIADYAYAQENRNE